MDPDPKEALQAIASIMVVCYTDKKTSLPCSPQKKAMAAQALPLTNTKN